MKRCTRTNEIVRTLFITKLVATTLFIGTFGKEQDTIHLLRQFNEECFNIIGVFQIERIVNGCNQMFHMFFNVFK